MTDKRMLLIGGYGIGNYGDESILAGLLNELPQSARKTVVSHDPRETSTVHGVDAVNPTEALKALRKHDLAIISGGIFSGHMGNRGKFLPLLGILSKTLGVNLEFRGLGVYSSTPKFLWPFIKASLLVAGDISVRDELSKKVLAEIGINGVHLVRDLSFFMTPAPKQRAIEILKKEGVDLSKRIVGISITRANPALTAEVTSAIRALIRSLAGKFEILMLPMCRHKKSWIRNDLLYSKEVTQGYPSVKILDGDYHPSEILSIFGFLESCVCMRFHSMIFAHRMGVDLIPIPYAEKCFELLVEIGVNPDPTEKMTQLAGGECRCAG